LEDKLPVSEEVWIEMEAFKDRTSKMSSAKGRAEELAHSKSFLRKFLE
jgi:hypothetical protein